ARYRASWSPSVASSADGSDGPPPPARRRAASPETRLESHSRPRSPQIIPSNRSNILIFRQTTSRPSRHAVRGIGPFPRPGSLWPSGIGREGVSRLARRGPRSIPTAFAPGREDDRGGGSPRLGLVAEVGRPRLWPSLGRPNP